MTLTALAGRTVRLALPLYLATLVLGALPTTVAMLGLGLLAGDRPWRGDFLGPGWLNLTVEVLMTAVQSGGSAGTALIWLALALLLPLAMLAQVAVYSFLAGGILIGLRAAPLTPAPASAQARRAVFLAACRRWFWPCFRLSLLGTSLVIAALLLGAFLASLVGGLVGPNVAFALQFAVQALAWGWIEASRAALVTEERRSVGEALRRGAQVATRPLSLVAWLLLAVPTSGLLLAAVSPPAIPDPTSVGGLLTALAFGQVVAYLGAWSKVVRLAVALRLVERAKVPGPAGAPAAVSRSASRPA